MRRMGGVLPVYRGGLDVDVHLDSARAVLDAGAVFGIFPEGTRHNPELELGRFRHGIGLIALRTGAPVLPVVLAGTMSLYRGRRISYRLLPPVTALELAGNTNTIVVSAGAWGAEPFNMINNGNAYYKMCIGVSPANIVKLTLESVEASFEGKEVPKTQNIELSVIDSTNIKDFMKYVEAK
jgi:hypothetical protein